MLKYLRIDVTACVLLCVGCDSGPTPQEQYNTALSVLEKENRAMAEAEAGLEYSQEIARKSAFNELHGHYPMTEDFMDLKRRSILVPGSEHEKQTEAEISAELDLQADFETKLYHPDSKESRLYNDELRRLKGYVAHQEQLKRVERAKKMVQEAEAALDD
jgi:hypothetical protein